VTEPDTLRVFVNGTALSMRPGATILDAVREFDAAEARAVSAGERAVTDSRGLPVALDTALTGGTVLRIVSGRALRESVDADRAMRDQGEADRPSDDQADGDP
jgi:hypothetical protein